MGKEFSSSGLNFVQDHWSNKKGQATMKRRTLLQASPLLWSLPSVSSAQSAFPNKPIRYIVPVAAGGGSDMVGRALCERWSKVLGQSLVVDNIGDQEFPRHGRLQRVRDERGVVPAALNVGPEPTVEGVRVRHGTILPPATAGGSDPRGGDLIPRRRRISVRA